MWMGPFYKKQPLVCVFKEHLVFIAFLDLKYHRRQCPKCFMCLGDLVETFEVVQQNLSAIVTTMTQVIYATVNSDAFMWIWLNCSFIVSSIIVKQHWGISIDASLSHNLQETHYDIKICLRNVVFAILSIFEWDLLVLANPKAWPSNYYTTVMGHTNC
jgi:hypothetical protein